MATATTYNDATNKARDAMGKAKEAAYEGAQNARETAQEAKDKISDKVADMAKQGAEKLEDVANKIQGQSTDAYKTMVEYVQQHPVTSLAAAALAGAVLIGMLRD